MFSTPLERREPEFPGFKPIFPPILRSDKEGEKKSDLRNRKTRRGKEDTLK